MVQPFASVRVTVYVPAVRPVIESTFDPVDQTYTYAVVPPEAVEPMTPVADPLHEALLSTLREIASAAVGCPIV